MKQVARGIQLMMVSVSMNDTALYSGGQNSSRILLSACSAYLSMPMMQAVHSSET
jgi:hypothetical protein